jgi:hypothetical protein
VIGTQRIRLRSTCFRHHRCCWNQPPCGLVSWIRILPKRTEDNQTHCTPESQKRRWNQPEMDGSSLVVPLLLLNPRINIDMISLNNSVVSLSTANDTYPKLETYTWNKQSGDSAWSKSPHAVGIYLLHSSPYKSGQARHHLHSLIYGVGR